MKTEIGFTYTVTDEQIAEHQKRSVAEIFQWLEETNKFLQKIQTPEERRRMLEIKGKYPAWFIDHLATNCPGIIAPPSVTKK
ncbi:MAG: hypothetical protein M3R17_05010 [Bacteroidota bacterium]|nr:hypothetical protein [Bacteroidota bacterium]